jgi:hypothetical protein
LRRCTVSRRRASDVPHYGNPAHALGAAAGREFVALADQDDVCTRTSSRCSRPSAPATLVYGDMDVVASDGGRVVDLLNDQT